MEGCDRCRSSVSGHVRNGGRDGKRGGRGGGGGGGGGRHAGGGGRSRRRLGCPEVRTSLTSVGDRGPRRPRAPPADGLHCLTGQLQHRLERRRQNASACRSRMWARGA